ncbi:hypothetical protein MTO96_002216 [Rhipicephalus appendiculatus]
MRLQARVIRETDQTRTDFQQVDLLRPGFLPTANSSPLIRATTAEESARTLCSGARSTQVRAPSAATDRVTSPNTFLSERLTKLPDDAGAAELRVCHSAFSPKSSSSSEVRRNAGTQQVWFGLQNRRRADRSS